MNVKLTTITPDAEKTIVEIARVSSSRKDKAAKPEALLKYLIANKHWSPFEHGHITFEIETSKAIGIQLIRHRSFTFQEFSQRYAVVDKIEPIELRQQATNNRQSSTEVFDPVLHDEDGFDTIVKVYASEAIAYHLEVAQRLYSSLLRAGVARECARMVLPMATSTTIFMTGTIRSWIHFLDIRDDEHAQKEIRLIAKDIKAMMVEELPIISKALNWK